MSAISEPGEEHRSLVASLKRSLRAPLFVAGPALQFLWVEWACGVFDEVIVVGGERFLERRNARQVETLSEALRGRAPAVVGLRAQRGLLDELEACQYASKTAAVCVTQAHLFLSPPPQPEPLEVWPTLSDVFHRAHFDDSGRYLAVFDDVLFSVPGAHAHSFAGAIQHEGARRGRSPWRRMRRAGTSLGALGLSVLQSALRRRRY